MEFEDQSLNGWSGIDPKVLLNLNKAVRMVVAKASRAPESQPT